MQNEGLVAERPLQACWVPELATDALLLLHQRHSAFEVATSLEDEGLVAETHLKVCSSTEKLTTAVLEKLTTLSLSSCEVA